jgi:hypothetical protein
MIYRFAVIIVVWCTTTLVVNAQQMEVYSGQNYYTVEKKGKVIVILKEVNDGTVELLLGSKKIADPVNPHFS